MTTERVYWVDNAKAVAIILVIIGHSGIYPESRAWIYSFHMHLFFFISGYCYTHRLTFHQLVINRFNTLMVPYFVFGVIFCVFWWLRRFYGDSPDLTHSILYPLENVLSFEKFWFLPCLFIVSLIFFFVSNKLNFKNFIPFALPMILIHYLLKNFITDLSIVISISFNAVVFYATGYMYKTSAVKINRYFILLLIPLNTVLFSYAFSRHGLISIDTPNIYFLSYPLALTGIFIFIILSDIISKNIILSFIGANTILIYLLHGYPPAVYERIFELIGLDIHVRPNPLYLATFNSIINIVVLVPGIIVINKFFPWMRGFKTDLRK